MSQIYYATLASPNQKRRHYLHEVYLAVCKYFAKANRDRGEKDETFSCSYLSKQAGLYVDTFRVQLYIASVSTHRHIHTHTPRDNRQIYMRALHKYTCSYTYIHSHTVVIQPVCEWGSSSQTHYTF